MAHLPLLIRPCLLVDVVDTGGFSVLTINMHDMARSYFQEIQKK
jgi:hypothetical protein